MEGLTDEERRALRGSKFAPLPPSASSPSRSKPKPRLTHPSGPLTINKATALAKFLERKLQDPNGLSSIKPELVELAVKNAKDTVNAIKFMTYKPYIHDPTQDLIFLRRVFPVGLYGSNLRGASHSGRIVRYVDSFGDYESSKDTIDVVVKWPKKKLKL
ncbi:unnamed protein product [Camellia sinensis]